MFSHPEIMGDIGIDQRIFPSNSLLMIDLHGGISVQGMTFRGEGG